jgi:hypothetical protein
MSEDVKHANGVAHIVINAQVFAQSFRGVMSGQHGISSIADLETSCCSAPALSTTESADA